MASNISDYDNCTSTPNHDAGQKASDFNPAATSSKMTTKKLSIGGISKISPKSNRLGKQSAGLEGSQSLGYNLSYLSVGLRTPNLTTQRASEIVSVQRGLIVTCHNVSFEIAKKQKLIDRVKARMPSTIPLTSQSTAATSRRESKHRVIHNISGYFPPGLNAIMGPSGSGKTSLLSILSLRNTKFSGIVRLNGYKLPRQFSKLCGYSEQDDVLNPQLTVREHIWFALCIRRSGKLSKHEQHVLVSDILQSLKLTDCADMTVGEPTKSRISGGERKRTNIGMELAAAPKLLYLDEPTSMLDSSTAKSVIETLKSLADKGRTVILTIHQPSFAIFRMFDTLTLMAKGRLIYQGQSSSSLEYFHSLGFPYEPHHSPPDYFLDILYGNISTPFCKQRFPTPHLNRAYATKSRSYGYPATTRPDTNYYSRQLQHGRTLSHENMNRVIEETPFQTIPKIIITRHLDEESYGENNNLEKSNEARATIGGIASSVYQSPSLYTNLSNISTYPSELDGTTCGGTQRQQEISQWLSEAYRYSARGKENDNLLAQMHNSSSLMEDSENDINNGSDEQKTFVGELFLLTKRALKTSIKLCAVLVIMNLVIGLFFGALFFHPVENQPPIAQNRLGLFFYLSVHGIMVPSMITTKSFIITEKALFLHERKSRYYRAISYCISRFFVICLTRVLSSMTLSVSVYWLSGLKSDIVSFLFFMATSFTTGLACDTLCLLCAVSFRSFSTGRAIVILYMTLTSLFAGFLLNLETTFKWLSWLKYISITRYCYVSWVIGEFVNSEHVLCPRAYTNSRLKHAQSIAERVRARQHGMPEGRKQKFSHCHYDTSETVIPEILGDDIYLLEHPWLSHLILLFMSAVCLVVCYWRMQKTS